MSRWCAAGCGTRHKKPEVEDRCLRVLRLQREAAADAVMPECRRCSCPACACRCHRGPLALLFDLVALACLIPAGLVAGLLFAVDVAAVWLGLWPKPQGDRRSL